MTARSRRRPRRCTRKCASSRASATPSSSPTTTRCPRSRTSPTTSATRSASRARRPRPTPSDRLLRRPLHGRDRDDPLAREDRADPRSRAPAARWPSSITAEQLRAWKAEHPGAVVVSYVNTTAEVKAESDYCCTSGNAKAVIEAIPARPGDPVPARHVPRPLARAGHRPQADDLARRVPRPRRASGPRTSSAGSARRPRPSCSCTRSAAARARRWRSANERTQILSTEGMVDFAKRVAEAALPRRDRERDHPPPAEGGARQALRAGQRGRRLPLHEDDHAREGARRAARLAVTR